MNQRDRRARALFEQSVAHHRNGRLDDAQRLYRQVLSVQPRHAESLYLLGLLAAGTGRHEEAARSIAAAIAIDPNRVAYHLHLGAAWDALGRADQAASAYAQAIRLQPDDARAHAALGTVLHALGRLDQAAASYRAALRLQPDLVDARCNLGSVLRQQGRGPEAIAAFRTALHIDPANAAAHYNLGNALGEAGRHDEALAAYTMALRLRPDDVQARLNSGNTLAELGRLDEALDAYDDLLQRQPDVAAAHFNRGNALKELGRLDQAVAAYETANRLRPDHAPTRSNLLVSAHYVAGIAPAAILARARDFARPLEAGPSPTFANARDPSRRLRIGYVSGDLGQHPVGHFLAPVLACHDHSAIEAICYSDRDRADPMAERLRAHSDHWRRLVGLSDEDAAAMIAADRIDILVDLAGHTAPNRLRVFAARAAPVQLTWLGYWGTTGLTRMDYILSDATTIPPAEESAYSERVLRLPGCRFCYAPPDDAPAPAPPPVLRHGSITFGSFNNLSKLAPSVVRLWSGILHAVPDSRLLLKWRSLGSEAMRRRIAADFAAHGIDPRRLELRAASPHATMLAEYGDVDIALDPFPFCGGLTTCEALWMGVPVVTLQGEAPQSRQTAGFLQALDRTDWIAGSAADYAAIAAGLAADPARLQRLRQRQRQRMAASPLCDGPGFTRGLEAAYRQVWSGWCAGEPV